MKYIIGICLFLGFLHPPQKKQLEIQLINNVLQRILIEDKNDINSGFFADMKDIVLLNVYGEPGKWQEGIWIVNSQRDTLNQEDITNLEGKHIRLISHQQTQKNANKSKRGLYNYLAIGKIDIKDNIATIIVENATSMSKKLKRKHTALLSGSGYELLYRYENEEWVFQKIVKHWVS